MLQSFFLFIPLFLTAMPPSSNISAYDEAKHVTFLEQNFTKARQIVQSLQKKQISIGTATKSLGTILAKCRHVQALLTKTIETPSRINSKRFLKLLQVQSLFEAYLTSEVLALDGDKDSELFGRALELRLMKTIPAFRP